MLPQIIQAMILQGRYYPDKDSKGLRDHMNSNSRTGVKYR